MSNLSHRIDYRALLTYEMNIIISIRPKCYLTIPQLHTVKETFMLIISKFTYQQEPLRSDSNIIFLNLRTFHSKWYLDQGVMPSRETCLSVASIQNIKECN